MASQLTNLIDRIGEVFPLQPALRRELADYEERVLPWNDVSQKRNALFYTFTTAASENNLSVSLIPDACADVLFCLDPLNPGLTVCHRRMKGETLSLHPGKLYFGFKPFSTKGMCVELDAEGSPSLEDVIHRQGLIGSLTEAASFDQRISLFCDFARRHLVDYTYHPDLVEQAEIIICATNGNIRVEDLGRELSYSPRYCRERFAREHGGSMKTTCDILRFQNLIRLMETHPQATDSELACLAGYFDQPHMIREFRKFAGITPRKFRQQYIVPKE